jgi:hypothetical protein
MDNQQPSLKKYKRDTHPKKHILDDFSGPEVIRTCVKCGVPKKLGLFAISRANRLGRHRHCKECGVKDSMKTYWEDPEGHRTKASRFVKRRKASAREQVFNHYGRECACCGESHPRFLTIDHVVPIAGAKKRDEAGHRHMHLWLVKNGFPPGFQILCWNCNLGRHFNGGVCPHKEGSQTIAQASSSKRSEAPGVPPQDGDMVETTPKGAADLALTFHDNESWPFASDRVQ